GGQPVQHIPASGTSARSDRLTERACHRCRALPGRRQLPVLRGAPGWEPRFHALARGTQPGARRDPEGTMTAEPVAPARGRPLDLRLIVITDRDLVAPRDLFQVVRRCLEAGAPAVQLRDKRATARELFEQARELRSLTESAGALLFVNDRADVALAGGADGVHIGPDDVPLAPLRRAVPESFLIGISTDDPRAAVHAEAAGADYIGCG